jgi:hypothetical protein
MPAFEPPAPTPTIGGGRAVAPGDGPVLENATTAELMSPGPGFAMWSLATCDEPAGEVAGKSTLTSGKPSPEEVSFELPKHALKQTVATTTTKKRIKARASSPSPQ